MKTSANKLTEGPKMSETENDLPKRSGGTERWWINVSDVVSARTNRLVGLQPVDRQQGCRQSEVMVRLW